MRLFSNGCSFLTPRPKDGVDTFTSEILAGIYDMSLHNLSMGGRGNDRISFTTKLWMLQNGYENVFAVIGWSSTHRHDYLTNDGWKKGRIPNMESTWRSWKTSDNLKWIDRQMGWDVDQQGAVRFIEHVVDLQNFFVLNKIPYVMYNSLPNPTDTKNADLTQMEDVIDKNRFYQFKSSHFEFIMKNQLVVSPSDPHPSEEGHRKWAAMLKEFIDVNNLRSI